MNLLILFWFVLLYSERNANELWLVLDKMFRWQPLLRQIWKTLPWFVSCWTWHKVKNVRIIFLGEIVFCALYPEWVTEQNDGVKACLMSGEKTEATLSVQRVTPRKRMTSRPERNIRENSVRFLMPMERQSGHWFLIFQFHIIIVKGSFIIGLCLIH